MKQLTDDQARVLLAFLGENWSAFVHCAECNGMDEVEADDLYVALGGESDG